jgi:DNA-binding transcriptional LysR family regulator
LEDIGGRIEEKMIRRAGIARPRIVATSNNSETLLALCLRGAGVSLCSETLLRAALTPEQVDSLVIIRRGDIARYPIRFGYQEKGHLWSAIAAFMETARDVMGT